MATQAEDSLSKDSSQEQLAEPLLGREDPLFLYGGEDDGECNVRHNVKSKASKLSKKRNLRSVLALTWFSFTGRSLWSQSTLTILVYLINKDQLHRVGYITAAMGFSQVIASFPARWLRNAMERLSILRLGAIVGAVATIFTFLGVYRKNYNLLMAGASVWGVMWAITENSLRSIFIDSIPDEKYEKFFRRGSRIIRSSNVLGPVIALGLYAFLGNEWTTSNCSVVMTIGLALGLPVIILLCCLLDEPDSSFIPMEEIDVEEHFDGTIEHDLLMGRGNPTVDCDGGRPETCEGLEVASNESSSEDSREEGYGREELFVPILICTADIISGIASGMSMRYFPVFFVGNLGFSPIWLQLLFMVIPLGQATSKIVAKGLAKNLGAPLVSASIHGVFVGLLLSTVYCYEHKLPTWSICTLFILHSSLVGSTSALTRAIMINAVQEEDADKWTVAETVQLLLWSIGAAVGGIVVGRNDVLMNFYATAAVQAVGALPLVLLCCLSCQKDAINDILFPVTTEEDSESSVPAEETLDTEDFEAEEFEDCIASLDSDGEFSNCHSDSSEIN